MPTIIRLSGVRVTTDETIVASAAPEIPTRRRGRSRGLGETVSSTAEARNSNAGEYDALLAALVEQEMMIVDEVELQPEPSAPPRRRGAVAAPPEAALELDLAADEDAVVLLEQEGFYSWHFPSHNEVADPQPARRGRGQSGPKRTARFTIELQSDAPTPAGPQRRGLVKDFLLARARAVVLKFAARVAVDRLMHVLEKDVRRGLILMDGDEPQRWQTVEDISQIKLPSDRSPRILLFVHGTFSSTVGSFGGLGVTPWGRAFLTAARANYDAVLGFDHATLSDDPLGNARDLLRRLQAGTLPHGLRLDAISYSRGGLVLRSLMENLLPAAPSGIQISRAIFVAVVNGGTLLSKPENWHTLIDLYTNLAAAACRAIALFPQVAVGALLMRELIQGVGAFAKYLATAAVTEGGIPGLAAMDPEGAFIRDLNETQPGQVTPATSQFYAILSQFTPRLALQNAREIPQQLVLALTNGLVDRLMGEANDLVVNTASMTAIDSAAGNFIKDRVDFGVNGVTYHTNYFLQPQTANALTRWLQLQAPPLATPARRRGFASLGGATSSDIPAQVDTDFLLLGAAEPADAAMEAIRAAAPSFVVLERQHQGETLRYAYPAEQLLERATAAAAERSGSSLSLLQALDLHEFQASPTQSVHALTGSISPSAHATRERVIAMEGDHVIGVVSEQTRPLTTDELIDLAAKTGAPTDGTDRIRRRRSLPTFAVPAPPSAAPEKVTCHFHAEMEEEVELAKTATIEVTISREEIETAARLAAAGGSGEVDASRKLIVQLLPKVNFDIDGDSRAELDLPAPGQPAQLYFDVRPNHEGEGEIWVVIRQGQVPLVNLILRPRIVLRRSGVARRIDAPASTVEAPVLTEPLHQLRIFERRKGDEVSYQFIFDSPALNLNNVYESVPLPGDRDGYIDQLYKEIEDRWATNQDDAIAFNEDLRAFGADLWDQLFPADLQADLWAHREQIRSIMVFSEEPFIPWELVHMKEPRKPLGAESAFLAQKGLVRWLHNFGWPPERITLRPGRSRYIIPEYPDPRYTLPAALEEAPFLEEKFRATPVEPQLNAVRNLLQEGGAFDLLHFAGHGEAEHGNIANAALLLQGRMEGREYVGAKLNATTVGQFARLEGVDGSRPIVVLNACQAGRAGYKLTGIGGFARAFLTGKAGIFVGALWSVGDQPARTFTEKFYECLLAGDLLAEAGISAREAARSASEATWLAYVVYGHPHATIALALPHQRNPNETGAD